MRPQIHGQCIEDHAVHTIVVRPCWVDHSLKIRVLNFQYAKTGRVKNVKNAKGMPFPMYGVLCLTTFSSVYDSKF